MSELTTPQGVRDDRSASNPYDIPEHIERADVLVRAGRQEWAELETLLFSRYPAAEWATFARFGWRETPDGLVLTLAALDPPLDGDLDPTVAHVAIDEQYTLRVALNGERHPLAIGVIHSHPASYLTAPSHIDDDMDRYYAEYYGDFTPGRPYVSLIIAREAAEDAGDEGPRLSASGRVYWRGGWRRVSRFALEGTRATIEAYRAPSCLNPKAKARLARLRSEFGEDAAERLARSTVAVVGASGTGSPALEVLARAGVGHLITVDPDVFDVSNGERVHGSEDADADDAARGAPIEKVLLARRHIHRIDPTIRVTAIRGRLPQAEVVDALVHADVIVGCTDQQHSRLAMADLAVRHLVPVIDCGVGLEGKHGRLTGQIVQLVRFESYDACPYCREMITWRISQELMSPEERAQHRAAAEAARARGDDASAYWRDMPQLNTVGYLTTIAGAMAAGAAIGWITGRADPAHGKVQFNLSAPGFEVNDDDDPPQPGCTCRRVRGWADQAAADAFVTPPTHWPPAIRHP